MAQRSMPVRLGLTATVMLGLWSVAGVVSAAETAKEPPRQIDMTHVLTGPDGKPARDSSEKAAVPSGQIDPDPSCDKCPLLTVGRVVFHALGIADRGVDGSVLWGRGELANRLKDDPKAELTGPQMALIVKQIGLAYPVPWVIEQTYPMIDPSLRPAEIK
jgi:hypothetical protein